MTDLATAKHIIDQKIAQCDVDVKAIFTAAQAKPAEQRVGFILETLDEAQRSADADVRLCDEIINATRTLKNAAANKTAAMRDALNDIVFQRCHEIEQECAAAVCPCRLTCRFSALKRKRRRRSTTFCRFLGVGPSAHRSTTKRITCSS